VYVVGVSVLCLMGAVVGALGDDDEPDDDATSEEAEGAAEENEDSGGDDGAEETVEFGDAFEAFTESGSGDATIDLPEGVTTGMVTASHDGDSNFSINMLDAGNQPTLDLLVNTIGSYAGTTAFGMHDLSEDPVRLQVSADGDWEITVASLNDAPVMELPVDGDGDAVYRYEAVAADWALAHEGDANFIVTYFVNDDLMSGFPLVNEIGPYDGTVPVIDGVGIVTIVADGSWTITAD
jgi:hypothetical protein